VLLDEAALVGDGALRRWHEEHEREGGRERGKVGTRSKKNLRRGEGRVEGRGGGRGREREREPGVAGEQMRGPASIYGGLRRELARGKRWKKFVETPQNWISRRSLFCQGFATRIGGIAWSAVVGSPDDPSRVPLNFRSTRSFSLAQPADRPAALRGNRQSAKPRQPLAPLTSAAGSMLGRNGLVA